MIDFNLDVGAPVKNSEIDLILQQIDMLFETNKKEILGDENFGSEYDRYLYNLNVSNEGLKEKVLSDLKSLDLLGWTPDVTVYLLQGTEQDIALINIILSKENNNYQKTYRIS